MSFVKLENLNDFIEPSSTCIKPIEKKPAGVVAKVNDINLSDCLACSGCITSAETVLVQQQTHEELFKTINDNKSAKCHKEIVVSLSLQGITSLAHKNCISPQEAAERIASFFISIGCDKVYDINLARHLALVEAYREFKARKDSGGDQKSPIISSICPGWICYAEKTNGELIIPHLSKVRSPQQIMGALLKEERSSSTGIPKCNIYHVTLMPCFDKKLEASRNDFKHLSADDGTEFKDVDCVLTPLEFEEILRDEGVALLDLERRKLDTLLKTSLDLDTPLTSHFGSVSGGYAENILLADASELLEKDEAGLRNELEYSVMRNNDFIEITLKRAGSDGLKDARRFAIVNGFRNIQTVVQRLKRNALKYDYIEIMACPSGCINGGAQCKPNFGEDRNQMIQATKRLYDDISKVSSNVKSTVIMDKIATSLNLNNQLLVEKFLHTQFHPVPKMQNLTVSW